MSILDTLEAIRSEVRGDSQQPSGEMPQGLMSALETLNASSPMAAQPDVSPPQVFDPVASRPQQDLFTTQQPIENPTQPSDWIKPGFALNPDTNPPDTDTGKQTPLYYPTEAIAGKYGPDVQRVYSRVNDAMQSTTRVSRFPWTGLAASTPQEDRNLTLMAVAQMSQQQSDYRDSGTLAKMGFAIKRDAERFKSSVDQTIKEAVENAFGKSKSMGLSASEDYYNREDQETDRLYAKALAQAAESGDPLVNPNDPFWKQWSVQIAEMTPTMATIAMAPETIPGRIIASGVMFPAVYDDARDELLSAGVNPDTARSAGALSAIVQSVIETFNLNPFKPKRGPDPLRNGLLQKAKEYAVAWGKEWSEEFAQGGVAALTNYAATQLDAQAPDLKFGNEFKQKMSDAMQAGGPLAVMMLPGFIGGLPQSRQESAARRWMVNNPERAVKLANKYSSAAQVSENVDAKGRVNINVVSRSDVPEIKDSQGRMKFAEEIVKQKPKYRWNPKTNKLEPKERLPFTEQNLTNVFEMEPEQAEATVALAESMGLDLSQIELAKGGEPSIDALAQKAYHGSPHTFDKFSTEKIGTGEGAQAYGWGLYFAGKKKVAEWYKNKLSGGQGLLLDGKPAESYVGDKETRGYLTDATRAAKRISAKSVDDLISHFSDMQKRFSGNNLGQHYGLVAQELKMLAPRLSIDSPKGRTYEVDLRPAEDEYLLWDKPLSEQPEKVREVIRKLSRERNDSASLRQVDSTQTTPQSLKGEDFYRGLSYRRGDVNSPRKASAMLREAGVRGIKYLDAMSRGKGDGEYNYVIFDAADVSIEAMYQGRKASVEFAENGKALIRALDAPDVSSGVHELAHVARRTVFNRDVPESQRAGITDADIDVAEKWAGAKDGKWDTKAEEKFARGFERYLRDGRAPTRALLNLFAKMKQWLTVIYSKLSGSPINIKISPEMRKVYNKLVTRGPSPAIADTGIRPPAKGYGRPELANPGVTQHARDAMDEIDQQRKEAGIPQVESRDEVEARAAQLIQNDYEGQVARVYMSQEEPNAEFGAVAQQLINIEADKAFTGDLDALRRRDALGRAYRERGTGLGREMAGRVDKVLGPAERLGEVKVAATELPPKVAKRVEKLDAPARAVRKRTIDADLAIDDAWKRLGAAFGGNLGSNLGNLPEAVKAAGDLVVAYARKGVYAVEDIIADLEAKRGQKLGAEVRQSIRDASDRRKNDVRAERVLNEKKSSEASIKRAEKNEAAIKKELSKHAKNMQRWKNDLKNIWHIDIDNVAGLSKVEADVAMQYLQAFTGGKFNKFLEWQRFVMLSALDSQFVNAMGNAQNLFTVFGVRYPLDWAVAAARGQANTHEFVGTFRALLNMKNIRRSAHTGWRAFKTESDVYEIEQAARPRSSAADYHGSGLYIRGRKGRALRAVGGQRGLLAMDNVAKSFINDAFVVMHANRVAIEEGFDAKNERDAYDARVQQLIDNHKSEAWKRATDSVHEATLQEKGYILSKVLQFANDGPGKATRLFLPFITTPWNVPKFALRHTPGVGTAMLAADIYRGDKAAINRGIAAQIMGFAGLAMFAAYNDPHDENKWIRFTGTENASYRRKSLTDVSKHRPYHMYLFGQPVDLSRFDPITTWIAVMVDTSEALKTAKNEDDYVQAAKAYSVSVARAMRDKTWIQTVADMVELFNRLAQDDGSGESFNRVVEWASKFVSDRTIPNLWRSISRDLDPYQKDARIHGRGEQRMERLPDALRIRAGFDTADDELVYDMWGDPMSMRDLDDAPVTNMPWRIMDFALRQVSALPMSSQKPFIGTDILMQWNIEHPHDPYWPGEPGLKYRDKNGDQVWMNPEQKAQFLRLSGMRAKYLIQDAYDNGAFNEIDKLTTHDRDRVKTFISRSRASVRRRLSAAWRQGETVSDAEILDEYGIRQ